MSISGGIFGIFLQLPSCFISFCICLNLLISWFTGWMSVPLPATLTTVDSVRFLVGGARIAPVNLTVRFHYLGGGTGDVVVPIAVDTV
ncbi:MAG: hypothetical protein AAB281_01160, partial [Actinomycetota bacterium]